MSEFPYGAGVAYRGEFEELLERPEILFLVDVSELDDASDATTDGLEV